MNIVTVINYPNDPYINRMCSIALHQLVKHNPSANIFVLHETKISDEIQHVISQYPKIRTEQRASHKSPFIPTHNIAFKLFNITAINIPFIFVDIDIFCLSPLDHLWDRRDDKPFIAIDHQQIPNHTAQYQFSFMNGGVQIVGDPSWFNYEEIEKSFMHFHPRRLIPGNEQPAIYAHCVLNKYDYRHKDIGFGWNACAGYTNITKENGEWVGTCDSIMEKDHPLPYKVHLNHYWNEFKPWKIACPIYKEGIQ